VFCRQLTVATIIASLLPAVIMDPANAQCQSQKLTVAGGLPREFFGFSMDLSGDFLVVGAPNNTFYGQLAGAAYVYQFDGTDWQQQEQLFPSRTDPAQMFGTSVAVFGDHVIVGVPYGTAPHAPSRTGDAYPFRFDGATWVAAPVLVASDPRWGAEFGKSVALGNDIAVIGAPFAGDSYLGAAYVFGFDGADWTEQAVLVPSTEWMGQEFGSSIDVYGDTIVVGSPSDGTLGPESGSAYVFRFNGVGWLEEARLLPLDLNSADRFGTSVAIAADTVVVGAPGNDDPVAAAGAAYVYRYNGVDWVQETKLLPPGGLHHEYFGISVDMAGDRIVVGAHFDGGNGAQAGSAHVYQFDGLDWVHQAELFAADGAPGDYLGMSIACDSSTVMVGAPRDGDNGIYSGSAYVFDACPYGFAPATPRRIEPTMPVVPSPGPTPHPASQSRDGDGRGGGRPGGGRTLPPLPRRDAADPLRRRTGHLPIRPLPRNGTHRRRDGELRTDRRTPSLRLPG